MKRLALLGLFAMLPVLASADEGMWTFDNPPRAAIKERYGVDLTDAWLQQVRLGTVRLESGCTGSFISGTGLILTNHHCAEECIAENSSAEDDLLGKGFLARTRDEEKRCSTEAVSVLIGTESVTAKVATATRSLDAAAAVEARRKALNQLEQDCEKASDTPVKCEAVTLYQGGEHWLYKYRRYDDVRLVFAPEKAIGAFGGDPDNFQFPRWTLDMSILRAWQGDAPATTPDHLGFDWKGVAAGEPVFVSGHPGSTSRQLTQAQLLAERNADIPFWLLRYSELRGRMIQYGTESGEAARTIVEPLNMIENSIKVRRKQLDALLDEGMLAQHARAEAAFIEGAKADPALASAVAAFDDIAAAQQVYRDIIVPYAFLEGAGGFNSDLFRHARTLVRAAAERQKPSEARLRGYSDARLPRLVQGLGAKTPYYPELDQVTLSFGLERMREWLGPDDPVVRQVFGRDDAAGLAARLIKGSSLADPAVRMALYEGGQAAIDASDDPMIKLALAVDAPSRALYKRMEEEVDGPTLRAQEAIAAARFALYGTSVYPDATFTLRFSYGAVDGWVEKGQPVAPFTRLERMFERATGRDPFKLPESWLSQSHALDMSTPVNFVSTLDITGGNSGSPALNADGEIVGLIFDGNIHSIAGDYWYDPSTNRAIAVDVRMIRTALEQVYKAGELLAEIDAKR